MIDITIPQNVRMVFDWGSKAIIALYVSLATASLMTAGYFIIQGMRRRVRLVNRPTSKATVEFEADAEAAP